MRTLFLALFLCTALAATAAAREDDRDRVLGYTADGNFLAYLPPPEIEADADNGERLVARADLAAVLDMRSGTEVRYLLSLSLGDRAELSKEDRAKRRDLEARYKALPNKAAWRAWQKANPVRCAAGRKSPDGKVGADVKVHGKGATGSWEKTAFSFNDTDANPGARATLSLVLVLDGKPLVSDTWDVDGGAGSLSGDVRLCWSPDSRHLAWLLHQDPPMMRDFSNNKLRVEPLTRPRLRLVAHKDIRDRAVARVLPLLEKAGYTIADSRDAGQAEPRPTSVVYAAAGQEATAKAVAALVPGGATVAPLDWKAAYDVIVAIGQSALGKP